jgi:hypothetical protein
MLLAIMLIYLAAVVCIMLFQVRCYKKYCHMLPEPHPVDFSEASSHLNAA